MSSNFKGAIALNKHEYFSEWVYIYTVWHFKFVQWSLGKCWLFYVSTGNFISGESHVFLVIISRISMSVGVYPYVFIWPLGLRLSSARASTFSIPGILFGFRILGILPYRLLFLSIVVLFPYLQHVTFQFFFLIWILDLFHPKSFFFFLYSCRILFTLDYCYSQLIKYVCFFEWVFFT